MGWISGSFIWDQLKISNSCYMAAAIQFNYAMFHIFSGPLFANLQGYAFLDLLIWGVSPLFFQLLRTPLRKQIKPTFKQIPSNYSQIVLRRRFGWLLGCFLAVVVSYLFMNYSPSFRWNVFSRIVNLDFGYLLFDIACRAMEMIVEIQEEEQQLMLIEERRETLEPVYHKAGYCKYRNLFMMASYFLVFYLSTVYDTNQQGTGQQIFTSLSILSVLFTLTIPFLYLFKYRSQNYNTLQQEEQYQNRQLQSVQGQFQEYSENDRRVYWIYILTTFAHYVNTSYFSLWVMQGLSKEGQNTYKQFNKTLFISSIFFLIASFLLFVISHIYIGCNVKEGIFLRLQQNAQFLVKLIKPFVIGYGILILAIFIHSRHQWHMMVIPILPFAFLAMITNVYCEKIAQWKEEDRRRYGHHKINFYIETVAYLVIPAILTVMGLGDSAVHIFGYLSAVSLIVAGLLMEGKRE